MELYLYNDKGAIDLGLYTQRVTEKREKGKIPHMYSILLLNLNENDWIVRTGGIFLVVTSVTFSL